MTGARITRARLWDAPALVAILRDFADEAAWLAPVRKRRDELALMRGLIRRGAVRVARHRRRILGFLAAEQGEIQAFYLRPDARGQGVGRALLAPLKQDQPVLGLWAHAANLPARRFYTATGFRPVRIGDGNDERLTEIRFEWTRTS